MDSPTDGRTVERTQHPASAAVEVGVHSPDPLSSLTFESTSRSSVDEVNGMKVSELASRTGVPASTVRFYDAEGLLPARRSSSGYRLFDDEAVDRLDFIGTAKRLGLPLPEIRRLLDAWEHGLCSDVQGELAPLLDRHLADTEERIGQLREFAGRLRRAQQQLVAIDRDGPCDPSCAFLGEEHPPTTNLMALPLASASDGPVIACTLDGSERTERADRWRSALTAVVARVAIPHGVRLTLEPAVTRLAELAELAAAESGCCSFFDISLHFGDPPAMEVRAPSDALALVHELFGEPEA
jgi:MerR family transcriptional regulator, copper efflux regulator